MRWWNSRCSTWAMATKAARAQLTELIGEFARSKSPQRRDLAGQLPERGEVAYDVGRELP